LENKDLWDDHGLACQLLVLYIMRGLPAAPRGPEAPGEVLEGRKMAKARLVLGRDGSWLPRHVMLVAPGTSKEEAKRLMRARARRLFNLKDVTVLDVEAGELVDLNELLN